MDSALWAKSTLPQYIAETLRPPLDFTRYQPVEWVGLKGFVGQKQVGDYGCWAAVAAALHKHAVKKGKASAPAKRQCQIADLCFDLAPKHMCKDYNKPGPCTVLCYNDWLDKPEYMEKGLDKAGIGQAPSIAINSGTQAVIGGVAVRDKYDLAEIRALLAAGHAVILRVLTGSAGVATTGHVIVVYECEKNGDGLRIFDPDKRPDPSERPVQFSAVASQYGPVNWKFFTTKLG